MSHNNNNNSPSTSSYPLSSSIRELSLPELTSLQSENATLRAALSQLQHQMQHTRIEGETSEGQHNDQGNSEEGQIDWSRVKAFMIDTQHNNNNSSSSTHTTSLSQPSIRQTDDAVIVSNTLESSSDRLVNVLEVTQTDWWTIINPTENDEMLHQQQHQQHEEDGYVIISEEDACEALADFISKSVLKQHPEAVRLSPQQLNHLLDKCMTSLRQPSALSTVWSWGRSAYTTYGWLVWAYGIYKEPAMMGLVASTAAKAASYLLVCMM